MPPMMRLLRYYQEHTNDEEAVRQGHAPQGACPIDAPCKEQTDQEHEEHIAWRQRAEIHEREESTAPYQAGAPEHGDGDVLQHAAEDELFGEAREDQQDQGACQCPALVHPS